VVVALIGTSYTGAQGGPILSLCLLESRGAPMRLIKLSEVMLRTGFKKTAIYSWVKSGAFPQPVKIGKSARWSLEEVEAWIQNKLDSRADNQ